MTSQKSNYLVVGATGGSGKAIVDSLLAKGKKVAILVRNKTTAKTFFKENYEKIDHVVEFELGLSQVMCQIEPEYNQDLLKALDWCDVVVSSLGVRMRGDPQKSDYVAIVELLNHCLQSKDRFEKKLFVYISTMYITRPYSFVAFLLNSLMSTVMGWKALAENRIRDSGLNYLIVRPGRLTDSQEEKTVEIFQGDSVKGQISRKNLAAVILNSINNKDIDKGKVTFEVVEAKNIGSQPVSLVSQIKLDDEKVYITADHFEATRNLTIILWGILTILFFFILNKI